MKKTDIKVGQRLARQRRKYDTAMEVEVVEVGVKQKGRSSWDPSFVGTKVRVVKSGNEFVIHNRELIEPWDTYSEKERILKEQRRQREIDRQTAQDNRLLQAFDTHKALIEAGFPTFQVGLYEKEVEPFRSVGFEVTDTTDHFLRVVIETPLYNLKDHVLYGKTLVVNAHVVADQLKGA